MDKDLERSFLDTVSQALISLPFDLKVLLEAVSDADLEHHVFGTCLSELRRERRVGLDEHASASGPVETIRVVADDGMVGADVDVTRRFYLEEQEDVPDNEVFPLLRIRRSADFERRKPVAFRARDEARTEARRAPHRHTAERAEEKATSFEYGHGRLV